MCHPVFPARDPLKAELLNRELESIEWPAEFPVDLVLLKEVPPVWELAIFEAARLAEIAEPLALELFADIS